MFPFDFAERVGFFGGRASADCVKACTAKAGCLEADPGAACEDARAKCEAACREADDLLFTGTKVRSGKTVIAQGQRIGIDPSAFGALKGGDLAPLAKHEVSAVNARGTFASSKTTSRRRWFLHRSTEETEETDLDPQ